MSPSREIKTALERSVKTLKLKPAKGRVTRKATIRIVDGLTCEVSERDWKMTSDVNRMLGGHESAPSPSKLPGSPRHIRPVVLSICDKDDRSPIHGLLLMEYLSCKVQR